MTPPEIEAFLQKAQESIDAAEDLIRRGSFGFATSRAYYSMFYCAQALLLSRDKSFSSQSAVIAAFGREFTKSRLLDARFHRYLRQAFDARQVADYDPIRHISRDTAEMTVEQAKEFLTATKAFLSRETQP